jgi:hypothetical protein
LHLTQAGETSVLRYAAAAIFRGDRKITSGPNSSITTIAPGLGSTPFAQFPVDMQEFLGCFLCAPNIVMALAELTNKNSFLT